MSLPELQDQELTLPMHFVYGTWSHAMAGTDTLNLALNLMATCNFEGRDNAHAIMRPLIPFLASALRVALPALQTKRGVPGRKVGCGS